MQKESKFTSLLKILLYNLKWISGGISLVFGLHFIESATDAYGITCSEEYIMYTFWVSLAISLGCFIYHNKWIVLCDKIINNINNFFNKK